MRNRVGVPWVLALVLLSACDPEWQVVPLSGAITLPAGRTVTLQAPEPLRTPALSGAGDVCLHLAPGYRGAEDIFAIRTPEGRLVRPTAELVRSDGEAHPLRGLYYFGGEYVCIAPEDAGMLRPPYVAVRLHSPETIRVEGVSWTSGDK